MSLLAAVATLASDLKSLPARLAYRRALAERTLRPRKGGPALHYGGSLAGLGIVHGGRVKLRHLGECFPESDDFNILYLVSSACPPHAMELVQWAKQGGATFVWNQNGVGFPAWAPHSFKRINQPMAALLHAADYVVYQSAFCQESADRFLGPVRCASEILFNPVDLEVFRPAPDPPRFEQWELLGAGTHHQPGRIAGALETLRHLLDAGRRARLTIAGELRWPRAEAQALAIAKRLGVTDAVRFLPPFTQEEAPLLYQAAHVLLHPKYHDPCPTVPIEAMASGVPVVGSRSGGMPELVGDAAGELIDVPRSWEQATMPDSAAMAEAVERIMSNWTTLSRSARTRAERLFDKREWVRAHEAIFHRALAAASASSRWLP